MKTIIWKFRVNNNLLSSNYFTLNNLTLLDRIEFERYKRDAFPIFREEFTQEDNVEVYKSGYYDMNLSLAMDETSNNGKTIYEFFNKVEDHYDYEEKYLILTTTDNIERSYAGIIDIGSIEANLSINSGAYDVSFSVTGIDKEAVDYLNALPLERYMGISDPPFESWYLPHFHFRNLSTVLRFESRLNINERVGLNVYFYGGEQRRLYDGGLNQGYSVYSGLQSYMIGLGIRFKVVFHQFSAGLPVFKIILYFRSDGLNELNHDLSQYLSHKKRYTLSPYRGVFVPFAKAVEDNPYADYYMGLLMGNNFQYVTDFALNNRFAYEPNRKVFQYLTGGSIVEIPDENILHVELPHHGPNPNVIKFDYPWNYAYCRCLYAGTAPNNLNLIIEKTTAVEYMYALKNVKSRMLVKMKVEDDSNLILNSRSIQRDRNYICERITSYDNFNKTMEVEWIEE